MVIQLFGCLQNTILTNTKKVKQMQNSVSQLGLLLPSPVPTGDVCKCLETFLAVTSGGMLLVANGERPTLHRTALHNQRLSGPNVSAAVEKLRDRTWKALCGTGRS